MGRLRFGRSQSLPSRLCSNLLRALAGDSDGTTIDHSQRHNRSDCARWRAGASEREAAAGLLPLACMLQARTCFCSTGPSKAPRMPPGRVHGLLDAAQAAVKSPLDSWGWFTPPTALLLVVFLLLVKPATKNPRKAVPARPRAAHVRPRKSDDEWATFPYMGPPRVALESPRVPRPHLRVLCERAWAAAPTRVRRWSSLLVVSRVRLRGGAASDTFVMRMYPGACVRTRGVLTNTCRHTAVC